ncbi:MAG: NAD-dependent epimerase/dehydratase family protein [Methanobacterium sp.]|uniref:NAD-dependent epimerase/dehydratase family protein n=1 Tax=Methanobacterium sp. TaxID=2164 RepID=UPI003C7335B8
MKTLITGCAGFVGSHLTERLLKNGSEVIGIDCFSDYYDRELKEKNLAVSLKNDKFTFIEKDILEMDEYPDVDYVYHIAAQAGVRDSWGDNFKGYTSNNIEVTWKLLEFYKELNIKKFVYSSSSSVYGDAELPMNEKSRLRPVSPYGVTKLAAENLCYLYWKNYKIPTISLRFFTVYGPRQRPDMAINKFFSSILTGNEIVVYGDGEQKRDFTFVDDAVNAILTAAESRVVGDVFNVGGGSTISVNRLINEIEEITGKKARVTYIEKQKGDVENTEANLEKIETVLRWKPTISIRTGLKKYMGWYTNNFC